MKPRGIAICVNYDDLLSITLPVNLRHLSECCVVTSSDDTRTHELAAQFPAVKLFTTDAFTRHGARFNKGLAMEEGLDYFGRHGRMLIWDADTLFPEHMPLDRFIPGNLHGAPRLILEDISQWSSGLDWTKLPTTFDRAIPGYFQLFDAGDPVLAQRPWYDPTFTHAGGGDAYFHDLWPQRRWTRLPFNVLHLGPRNANWFGRSSERTDGLVLTDAERNAADSLRMEVFHGWKRKGPRPDGHTDRVNIPGFKSRYAWHKSGPQQ